MAYDDANADYGQYQDLNRDKKLAADGHYWSPEVCPPFIENKVVDKSSSCLVLK
jgi:hypothetical protein